METTPELIIFLIVGAVAVFAAVMMLISENAVHSALFLILNFACVAFFYLMLNAAFLAMVQVTVYAGAIMVLFMFVIMLLGAERVAPEEKPRFPWLTPAAVVLTAIFLITAGVGILEADISATTPEPLKPTVRVLHVAPELEAVDVRLNDESISEDAVRFHTSSDIAEWEAGDYEITAVADGEPVELVLLVTNDPMADKNLSEQLNDRLQNGASQVSVEQAEPNLHLEDGQDIALVVTTLEDGGYGIIPVEQNFRAVERGKTANIQLVNAVPSLGAVDFADITQTDREPFVLFENIGFGQVSEIANTRDGQFDFAIYPAGTIQSITDEGFNVRDVPDQIARLRNDTFNANSSGLYVIAPPLGSNIIGQEPRLMNFAVDNRAAFGGPTSVGELLYTRYMLPFQVVALLLLVAMIGAIVLTRDQIPPPRPRFGRRLASTPGSPLVSESSED